MTVRTNRGGNGRFTRSIKTTERDYQAAALRARGRTLQAIAAELGYASRGHVVDGVHRAFASLPKDGVEDAKCLDLERLDRLIEQAWDVMEREHVAYSNGRVVRRFIGVERDEDGIERLDADGKEIPVFEDVLDDGPILASVREIRGLIAQRGKIEGYEAPSRSRVEIITPEMVEAAITRLEAELALNDPADTGAG